MPSPPLPSHPEKPNLNSEHECHDVLYVVWGSANCPLPNDLFSFPDQKKHFAFKKKKIYEVLNAHYR